MEEDGNRGEKVEVVLMDTTFRKMTVNSFAPFNSFTGKIVYVSCNPESFGKKSLPY